MHPDQVFKPWTDEVPFPFTKVQLHKHMTENCSKLQLQQYKQQQ